MADQGAAGRGLGPLEAEVLAVFWRAEVPLIVREVVADLNAGREAPLAYRGPAVKDRPAACSGLTT